MEQKETYKSGFVALVGRPNVGKSTLMNRLVGQKVAITSNKPQTTRNRIQTVYTCEKGQIIFFDTPGIHKAKNKLGDFMMNVANHTIADADVIVWLVEPDGYIGASDQKIAKQLEEVRVPVILVINKTDMIKKEEVAKHIEMYQNLCPFAEILATSALRGKNTFDLIDLILKYLPYGPQYYDEDTLTDQPMRQIAAEVVREKALHALNEEIPHGIAVTIEKMKERPDGKLVDIEATIVCERESHKGIIIGKKGSMLKKIGSNARYELEQMLDQKVNLQLWVKVRKEWRDSELMLKNFGYKENKE